MYPLKCTLSKKWRKSTRKSGIMHNAYLIVKNARASRALRWALDPGQYHESLCLPDFTSLHRQNLGNNFCAPPTKSWICYCPSSLRYVWSSMINKLGTGDRGRYCLVMLMGGCLVVGMYSFYGIMQLNMLVLCYYCLQKFGDILDFYGNVSSRVYYFPSVDDQRKYNIDQMLQRYVLTSFTRRPNICNSSELLPSNNENIENICQNFSSETKNREKRPARTLWLWSTRRKR